jgi:acyl carrier protein
MTAGEQSQQINQKVKDVIIEVLRVNEADVTPQARFIEDLGADSLDRVTMLMALEDAFGSEISDDDAEKLVTLQDTVSFIQTRL